MDARAVAARSSDAASFTAKAGSTGKLFGSVGSADIAAKIGETLGSEFDRHNVVLADPIKELGDYQVSVKLTKNVTATVSVSVIGEDGTTGADIKARASGGADASAGAATDESAAGDRVLGRTSGPRRRFRRCRRDSTRRRRDGVGTSTGWSASPCVLFRRRYRGWYRTIRKEAR
jgi:hypothetical protein